MYHRITVVAILFFLSVSAQATVILSIDDGVNLTIIYDGGDLDINPLVGAITYVGVMMTEDGLAGVNVSTGISAPLEGDLLHPILQLTSNYTSFGAGQLTIGLTSTGFLGPVGDNHYSFGMSGNGASGATVDLSLYVDTSNAEFGRGGGRDSACYAQQHRFGAVFTQYRWRDQYRDITLFNDNLRHIHPH